MTLPRAVSETLVRFGVSAETRAGLDDLYRALGSGVVDALADLSDRRKLSPAELRPDDLLEIRAMLGETYLRENHAEWLAGNPTAAFWRNRSMEGGATGLAVPLGRLEDEELPEDALARRVAGAVRRATGPNQPSPRGLLVSSRNSHFGNRPGVFSLDLVASELDEALVLNASVGQQHTLPGSIGEASGTAASSIEGEGVALLWEVQPNVYKPTTERNRDARGAFRRYRNWPIVTAIAALAWLRERGDRIFVLRGASLASTHEVNPAKPVSAEIERLHDRTIAAAASALDLREIDVADDGAPAELRTLANVGLGKEIDRKGIGAVVREIVEGARSSMEAG